MFSPPAGRLGSTGLFLRSATTGAASQELADFREAFRAASGVLVSVGLAVAEKVVEEPAPPAAAPEGGGEEAAWKITKEPEAATAD